MPWLYYKIYAEDTANWYYRILKEVVKPFTQQNQQLIDKYFFFHYREAYAHEGNCKPKFEVGAPVRYVRLRARAREEDIEALERSLIELTEGSQTTLETEKCEFDVNADLGNRFGQQRTELAVSYLDALARMVLSLLTDGNQLENGAKPYSAIHLIHNMMGDQIPVACANCGVINQVPPLTVFECQTCHEITYF
jgi:hypothetical protein